MNQTALPEPEQMLTPREVADLFGVDPKTVSRWSNAGKIEVVRTPGGHRRFRRSEVDRFLTPASAPVS